MSSLDPFSPRGSVTSSVDSACLPPDRIRCSAQRIVVGDRQFTSASDALVAYLQQFNTTSSFSPTDSLRSNFLESPSKLLASRSAGLATNDGTDLSVSVASGSSTPTGREGPQALNDSISAGLLADKQPGTHVEELLTSKVSTELQTEVTDTLREVKLRRLLKQAALKSQNQTKTGLQQEVEAALTRSAELLERVTQETTPRPSRAPSESGSLATDALLSDSTMSLDMLDTENDPTVVLSNIYPHRRSRARQNNSLSTSLSQSLCAPVSYRPPRQSRERIRHSSLDNLSFPLSSQHFTSGLKRSSSSSSATLSNQSDPTDILRRIRSRSVSPGLRQLTQSSAPQWVEQLDHSVEQSVPKWVGELASSEVSDYVWSPQSERLKNLGHKRPNGTKVPSWIGEVDNSSITDSITHPAYPLKSEDFLKHQTITQNGNDISMDSHRGLNYSDRVPHLSHTPTKQVTFTDLDRTSGQPKHSTPLHNSHPISAKHDFLPKPSRVLDSEFNGEAFLRNNILPQTARLKKSIDNFMTSSENLGRKSTSSNSSEADSDNRCSSLDTQALLLGKPLTRMDVTGVSSIPKDSQMANSKSFSASPTISAVVSPDPAVGSHNMDTDGSEGLDGDRPWEKLNNVFKAPVPVEEPLTNGTSADMGQNKTLSGGKQPGSMEALKNMLYKLQAEEHTMMANGDPETPAMATLPALEGYDFGGEPGGHSLEKALVHLNRLKNLVKTTAVSTDDIKVSPSAQRISDAITQSKKESSSL